MQQLFGVPIEHLAGGAALACAAVIAAVIVGLLQRPILGRLAWRNIPRRPGPALLVVAGLALGTTVVTSALFTGDTMTYTVRSLVADSLGRVDEVIVQSWLGVRGQNRRWIEAIAQGAPLTAGGGYFDAAIHERLTAGLSPDSPVAALVPAIVEQGTLVDLTTQQLVVNANVLGLPADFPAVLGALAAPDGAPLALARLGRDAVYINQEAASQLAAEAGDALQLRLGDQTLALRLAGLFATGDLGGARPTVVFPLPALQEHLGRPGQINQVLVVNRGDRGNSVRGSAAATRELRGLLIDDATADAVLAALRPEAPRRSLAAVTTGLADEARERLERLLHALDQPKPTARPVLKDVLADPELAARLGFVAMRLPEGDERAALFAALNGGDGLRVLELKRVVQERADRYASILTSIFLVLGLFSIATGLMLVFLVFVLLAAARRTELGVARALGARRRDLTVLLLAEGLAYALGAAGVGLAAGVAIGHALVALLQRGLEPFGLTIRPHIEPASLALAGGLGLLLSLVTVAASAWWTSRLNVAAAMRNQAEPTGRTARWLAPALSAALLVAGIGLVYVGKQTQGVLPTALGLSAGVLAAERALAALGLHRLGATVAGLALLGLWWEPAVVAQALGLGRMRPTPELYAVAGVAMTLAAVWVLAANAGLLLAAMAWLARPLGAARLPLRLAAAYLGQQRFRVGTAMAMFALVLCSLTVSAVLLAGAQRAYGRPDAENAGYDLRAQTEAASAAPSNGRPVGNSFLRLAARAPASNNGANQNGPPEHGPLLGVPDLRTALRTAPAARPEDFSAIGTVATLGGELIRLGGPRAAWQPARLSVLDPEFLATTGATLSALAPGYGSAADVWRALAERPGLAVLGAPLAATLGLGSAHGGLEPGTVVWVRALQGGQALRLEVIGVLGARSPLGDGVFVGAATVARVPLPAARQVTYFLRTREGLTPERAASALNFSFADRGLRASVVDPELRLTQAIQAPLTFLLQGFMGLGLVSGVLAVGLLAARAVFERRAQLGMLRAVGMRARTIQVSLLLEGSVVALAGAGIGLAVGVALAGQVVRFLQRSHPELPLVVPGEQLAAMAALSWGASLLAAAVPVWRAGRVAPVEALRAE